MTDYGFRGNAGSSSSAIKLRIYFWNPSLLLDAAPKVLEPLIIRVFAYFCTQGRLLGHSPLGVSEDPARHVARHYLWEYSLSWTLKNKDLSLGATHSGK